MNKVIESLKHMADRGGYWTHDYHAEVWHLSLGGARSNPYGVGFSQDDLREFLKNYNKLIVENEKLKHCIKLLNEHYDEVTRCD